jgi:DoxX-like family
MLAELGEYCDCIPLNREMLTMLHAGNSSDDQALSNWLMHKKTPLNLAIQKIVSNDSVALKNTIQSYLKSGLVFIWIWTALISLLNYQEGIYLLDSLNISIPYKQIIYPLTIIGGAALDVLVGIFILFNTRYGLKLSLFVMLIYSLIVSVFKPVLWLDPLGAMSKNLPIAIMAWVLLILNTEKDERLL